MNPLFEAPAANEIRYISLPIYTFGFNFIKHPRGPIPLVCFLKCLQHRNRNGVQVPRVDGTLVEALGPAEFAAVTNDGNRNGSAAVHRNDTDNGIAHGTLNPVFGTHATLIDITIGGALRAVDVGGHLVLGGRGENFEGVDFTASGSPAGVVLRVGVLHNTRDTSVEEPNGGHISLETGLAIIGHGEFHNEGLVATTESLCDEKEMNLIRRNLERWDRDWKGKFKTY